MCCSDYQQDGEVAKRIAAVIPYYPYKGIPRFYDINGFLQRPEVPSRKPCGPTAHQHPKPLATLVGVPRGD